MKYTPTPHQEEDSDAMLEYQHSLLWADAGTGKTVTALLALQKGGYDRVMIVAPPIALSMWAKEVEENLGWRSYIMRKPTPHKKGLDFNNVKALITTYDLVRKIDRLSYPPYKGSFLLNWRCGTHKEIPEGERRPRAALILDEAHYIKSAKALRTKSILSGNTVWDNGIWYMFDDVWQLTATPVLRHSDDLFTQLIKSRREILDHYDVNTLAKFQQEFCVKQMKSYGGVKKLHVTGSKNHKRLAKLLSDCGVIRRKLVDVVENLPPITHRHVDINYKLSKEDNIDLPDNQEELIHELSKPDSEASRCRRLLGIAKAPAAVAYALEFANTPYLIGYWHKDVATAYEEALSKSKLRVAKVDGSTPVKVRDQIQEDFNAGKIDVLLGQMQAMGTSWNLQERCNRVLVVEELPSEAMLYQFYSRVYRRGQKNHVQVDHLRTNHPIDVAYQYLREAKAKSVEKII